MSVDSALELETGHSAAATERSRQRTRLATRLDSLAVRDVSRAFIASRLLVLLVALTAAHIGSYSSAPADVGLLFQRWPPSGVLAWLFDPFVRGDSVYLLGISLHGYNSFALSTMFPGFPIAVHVLGGFGGPMAAVVVGCLLSGACFALALYLLHRLVSLEAGARIARVTVLLIAFSPLSLFFSVPYTESLFLVLSVGALYAAKRERLALACCLAAAAGATRNVGVMLAAPIALLFLYPSVSSEAIVTASPASWLRRLKPRRRPGPALLWLLLVPVGLGLFSLYLHHRFDDALAWKHAEALYGRETAWPWVTVIDGIRAAWHFQATQHVFYGVQLQDLAFLLLAILGTVAVFRLLPVAYGVYTVALLLPALTAPAIVQEPLRSFPRYTLVAFPLYIALAKLSERYRITPWVTVLSAVGLIGLTAAYVAYLPYF